jgi:hypothetical protein
VAAGEPIDFIVSMNPAGSFVVDIYRMGYYGGAGGHYLRLGPFRAESACAHDDDRTPARVPVACRSKSHHPESFGQAECIWPS